MKLFKNIYLMAGALALCTVGFASCDDDDTYDFPGDPYNKVYTADHSMETKLVQTPVGTIGELNIAIPARCKSQAEGDIQVVMEIDNSLIDEYNTNNGTNYLAMPENAIVVSNKSLVIPKGELMSDTTFNVTLTDDADILASLDNAAGYIIPVRMSSVSGGNAQAAVSVPSISYFTVGISFDVTDPDASKNNRKGSLVDDRSGWTVAAVGNASINGDPADWFSDNGNSCTFSDSEMVTVVVDLGKEYTFDGITASYDYYGWASYGTFTNHSKIALSSDNSTWMEVYECENAGWSGVDFVGFYGGMSARYIRITAPNPYAGTSWADWYSAELQCSNFNIYAIK
ncbi:MAG: DUF1735 domain-containing protein [Barnesiella sp.]|nr:DUF1735 domain-containing protein [Barnesiella sp.]